MFRDGWLWRVYPHGQNIGTLMGHDNVQYIPHISCDVARHKVDVANAEKLLGFPGGTP
jgi:selenocysteine lyase/cysteine desulfurase